MTKIIYEIIEHDGGWAYKVGTTYSETFHSRDDALAAARIAAAEQQVAGSSEGIEYEDSSGKWHHELAEGTDRPEADVAEK
jgi:S-adenosylmethionine hydrolase